MKIISPALALVLVLLMAGCTGAFKPVDTAAMPPGFIPPGDPDIAALFEAETAFPPGAPRPATPQAIARAVADVDYTAGAFNTHIRWWGTLNPGAQEQMLIARREIRAAVGIAPDALSQDVVNALLAASTAPDQQALLTALANPVFTLGPQATLDRLTNMPRLATTPYALIHIDQSRFGPYEDNL